MLFLFIYSQSLDELIQCPSFKCHLYYYGSNLFFNVRVLSLIQTLLLDV